MLDDPTRLSVIAVFLGAVSIIFVVLLLSFLNQRKLGNLESCLDDKGVDASKCPLHLASIQDIDSSDKIRASASVKLEMVKILSVLPNLEA